MPRDFNGTTAAASMTPEARRERARKAAMARHYSRLIPIMVAYLSESPLSRFIDAYPSLQELPAPAFAWVFKRARKQMGY